MLAPTRGQSRHTVDELQRLVRRHRRFTSSLKVGRARSFSASKIMVLLIEFDVFERGNVRRRNWLGLIAADYSRADRQRQ